MNTTGSNAREIIAAEKLRNILNPRESNELFKITVRFQKHLGPSFAKALELARKNPHFLEEGQGDYYRVYASFFPEDAQALHELFQYVKDQDTTRLFLNNKPVPYIQDLWLFLMWFYRVR